MTDRRYVYATGRRKSAIARVQLHERTGQVRLDQSFTVSSSKPAMHNLDRMPVRRVLCDEHRFARPVNV